MSFFVLAPPLSSSALSLSLTLSIFPFFFSFWLDMFISARVELIRSCCCEKNRNATEAKKYYQTDGFFFLASDGRWWNSVGWRIGFLFFFCLSAKETLKSEFDQRIGPVSERSHRSTPHPEKQRIARFRRKKNAHTHACNLNGDSPATLTDRSFPHWPSVGLVVCVFFFYSNSNL